MSLQHKNIPDAQLHEPKGIASATSKSVYVSTGAGTGVWRKQAQGSSYFENIGTPYVLTFPAAYTKLAPTTTANGSASSVTEGTNARLTYTGSATVIMNALAILSFSHAAGANRDWQFAVYKNGVRVNGSVVIVTAVTATKYIVTLTCDVSLATNDFIEIFAQNNGATGDISVYTFNLMLDPQDN